MKVGEVRREASGGFERLAATVSWEESARPDQEIFFRVPGRFADALSPGSDAFALAAAIPAALHGERRLRVAGSVCPRLRDGIVGIHRLLRSWYGEAVSSMAIEVDGDFRPGVPAASRRAAVFLSGGLDSLFALEANRADFPRDHPASFADAIFVNGFAFHPRDEARAADVRARSRRAAERIAAARGLELIEVETNVRDLEPDFGRFARAWFAPVLAAVAHALGSRVRSATAAADLDAARLRAWGAHPLLYTLASSASIAMSDVGGHLSRLERARFLARTNAPLETLCVCQEGPIAPDPPNCGRCEKCVRTLLEMIIAGVPKSRRTAFAHTDVDAEAIARIRSGHVSFTISYFWSDLAEPLEAAGRTDLARAVRSVVDGARRSERWFDDAGWRGRARRMDRRLLGGALLRASRAVRKIARRARPS
jgi:hypothetical protein